MNKQNTVTARQLVRNEGLSLDLVFAAIDKHGMSTRKLYPDDVKLIKKELKRGKTQRPVSEDTIYAMPAIDEENLIVKIRDPSDKVTRYMFARDLNSISHDTSEIPFSEFLDQIETDIEYNPRTRPRTIQHTPTTTRKPTGKREKTFINGGLVDYLVQNRDSLPLRAWLYGEPREDPVNLTHSTGVLEQIVNPETIDLIKSQGRTVESLSPEALMKIAQKMKKLRIRTDVMKYFTEGLGEFMTTAGEEPFDLDWKRDDDVTKVISWLEPRMEEPEMGLPFYMHALKTRLGNQMAQVHGSSKKDSLFRGWVVAASTYEFARSHPYTKAMFTKRAKAKQFEDLAVEMINDFKHNEEYKEGDARRFLGGLYVAGKAVPARTNGGATSNLQDSLRMGAAVDYLLIKYDEIGKTVSDVMQRIRSGDLVDDPNTSNNKLYTQVREGEFSIEGKREAKHLGRAVRAQMNEGERNQFIHRLVKGDYISDSTVDRIVGWYVQSEKDSI